MRADGTEADLPPPVPTAPHSVAEHWPESVLKASAVAQDEAKSAAPVARRFEKGGSRAVRSPESAEMESAETESAETESAEMESAEMAAC